jgi:prepilin-type N-terminal cleavage/methylation domain-containing protein
MNHQPSPRQTGFTLIEIAIVLVIIGLLLGGILKGQELINSAKVKNLAADFRNVPVYVYGYQDKYRALPGDDKSVVMHNGGVLATTGGTVGNGVIEGAWNSTTPTDESYLFWQHVRLAGLAPGSTVVGTPEYLPTNAMGGALGISNSGVNAPIAGIRGSFVVCSGAIPGKFARQLDSAMDDGNGATGSMLAAKTPPTATTLTPEDDDTPVVVCMGF